MKRLILAASIALSAAAFADSGKPFQQLDLDRALPNLPEQALQYAEVDRGSRVDASSETTESPWAKDHNFIAPPL